MLSIKKSMTGSKFNSITSAEQATPFTHKLLTKYSKNYINEITQK